MVKLLNNLIAVITSTIILFASTAKVTWTSPESLTRRHVTLHDVFFTHCEAASVGIVGEASFVQSLETRKIAKNHFSKLPSHKT